MDFRRHLFLLFFQAHDVVISFSFSNQLAILASSGNSIAVHFDLRDDAHPILSIVPGSAAIGTRIRNHVR